ncbi:MAG: FkbM family methyltransferase, partial [Planctomycetes bacterium]|nr:FkbM family methyltransferase [Planctomycetota bacterium]
GVASRLPARWQQRHKRRYLRWKIGRGAFHADEAEESILPTLLSSGDWALDVGANVGHYASQFSRLVGSQGRVIALEPTPATFELLTANSQLFAFENVTLLNVAASNGTNLSRMETPRWSNGAANYYESRLDDAGNGPVVLTLPVDALALPHEVRLVKIDTEGHELAVLEGMAGLIERDRPTLIVEANDPAVIDFLAPWDYHLEQHDDSPNYVFRNFG